MSRTRITRVRTPRRNNSKFKTIARDAARAAKYSTRA